MDPIMFIDDINFFAKNERHSKPLTFMKYSADIKE